MTKLAQQLGEIAKILAEKKVKQQDTMERLYHNLIYKIRSHQCLWNCDHTVVTANSDMELNEPIIHYHDFSYVLYDECNEHLRTLCEKDGFKLVSVSIDDKNYQSITLGIIDWNIVVNQSKFALIYNEI